MLGSLRVHDRFGLRLREWASAGPSNFYFWLSGSTILIKGPFETKEKYRNFGGFQFYREITYVALEERI